MPPDVMSTLPSCRPVVMKDLRGSLSVPAELAAKCAVVGSSDLLRLQPRGAEIDAHTLVWRFNNAPTKGWEAAVGSRTDVRVVNHLPIEKWVKLARNRSALKHTADGGEYEARLCAPNAVRFGCVVSRMHAPPRFQDTIAAYRRSYAPHQISLMSAAMHQWGVGCNRELHGTSPSSGLFSVLLALATCKPPISLYGFWPFCCRRSVAGQPINYKYHQGNRTRWVCCSRGRERMEVEFEFYQKLARQNLVRLRQAGV